MHEAFENNNPVISSDCSQQESLPWGPPPPYQPYPMPAYTPSLSQNEAYGHLPAMPYPCLPSQGEEPPPYDEITNSGPNTLSWDHFPTEDYQQNNYLVEFELEEKKSSKCLMVWSILNFIIFPPFGIVALIYAKKMRKCVDMRDFEMAKKYSWKLLKINLLALVSGIIIDIIVYALLPILIHFSDDGKQHISQ